MYLILPRPVMWFIDITSRCNLKCKHCYFYFHEIKKENNKELSTAEIIKILEKTVEPGNLVHLSGGEPLLRHDLDKIVKKIHQLKGIASITTNGTLIDNSRIDSLLHFDRIQISLDGLKETHEYFRGKGSFDLTLSGIEKLIEKNKKFVVGTILTKKVIQNGEVFRLLDFLEERGVPSFRIMRFIPKNKFQKKFQITKEEYKKVLFQLIKERKSRNIKILKSPFEFLLTTPPKRESSSCVLGCGAGFISASITVNGYMVPCTTAPYSEDKDNFLLDKYNIVEKIYQNHPIFIQWRNQHPKTCEGCPYFYMCYGGCRAAIKDDGKDPLCWIRNQA